MAGSNVVAAIGPSYHLNDRKAASQTAVNCYLEQVEGLGETRQLTQVSAPGLRPYLSLGFVIRGQRNVEGRHFVVAGAMLYEIVGGVQTSRGTLTSSVGYVGMSHNNSQLVIVDGPSLWILTLSSNVFANYASAGWRGSKTVDFIDGYSIFVALNTQQLYISLIDNATIQNALDFSSADAQPDNIVTSRVSHRELLLFGTYTTEVWINTGAATFPFVRYNSAQIDVGCVGPQAAIVASDSVMWIGQTRTGTGIVYRMIGHSPQRVSNRAVEQALAASTDISQSSMWTYQVDGHEFIGINAPGLSSAWVYDAAAQQWHERAEWNYAGVSGWSPLRLTTVCYVNQVQYGGDVLGNLYTLDPNYYQNGTSALVRERTWPHLVSASMEPIRFASVELSCSTGNGGNVSLELSNDGGSVFGSPLIRSLGVTGRRMQKVRWHMLGTANDRVFRIRCSDAVPFNMYAAAVLNG